ncbi:Nif3-like dinuclear metal center hexameric protein [[Clostridium] fimetarium]|uniref:GTP cyclohydrolase 1 type 2 homolog n=1 Tax=[Clostridium] fimetarium TaxID=99656 RepID=A0A1I0QCQ0_9FIRM|nr:Nif3-like dinuclear metal center hexameric protein [[Clostridium] fimetarium]SEW24665.1 dinuclear metal center protein, YbgI/SA1388 family [[Clostridium] fimetarium]
MKCSEIIEILELLSPKRFACDWDNVGLMVGSPNAHIKKILVTLDGDDAAIDEAIKTGSDLIITHHPLIFNEIKNVTTGDLTGRRIIKLIQNDICVYSMHTNFDVKGGMAQLAADMIGIQDGEVLEDVCEGEGLGRVGTFGESLTVRQWADKIKALFGLPNVCVFGNLERIVSRVAISPGSGKDFVQCAIEKGAQLFISGDINHHSGIDANAQGLEIIDAGHYGIEHIFIKFISEYLESEILASQEVQIVHMNKKLPFVIV